MHVKVKSSLLIHRASKSGSGRVRTRCGIDVPHNRYETVELHVTCTACRKANRR